MFPAALLCAFDRRAGSERGLARNSVGELVLEGVPAPPASGAGPLGGGDGGAIYMETLLLRRRSFGWW